MRKVTGDTVIELHELCLDICPFPTGDRAAICPKCPVFKQAAGGQWRFALTDGLKLVKAWATYVGKQIK